MRARVLEKIATPPSTPLSTELEGSGSHYHLLLTYLSSFMDRAGGERWPWSIIAVIREGEVGAMEAKRSTGTLSRSRGLLRLRLYLHDLRRS